MSILNLISNEKNYARILMMAILAGIALGILGDYRGRQLNNNQIKALKNHEIIIQDYEKLIQLHNASLYVIDRFLAQEKELIQDHNEYVKAHQQTHEMLTKIYNAIQAKDERK